MSEKQYDPRMHSAEHILNQTMVRIYGCRRSINSHIERKKSKCDYQINSTLNTTEIQYIETKVNEIIAQDLPVTEEMMDIHEASKFLDLSKLPDNPPEYIRVVRIGDYDACACIGPHVETTAQIGYFRIISVDNHERYVRIRFKLE